MLDKLKQPLLNAERQSSQYHYRLWEAFIRVICWIFPQDASGDLNLCPLTSKICEWCTGVCIVIAVIVHITCEYASVRPAVSPEEDPTMQYFLWLTSALSLAGLIYELMIKVSIKVMNLQHVYESDPILRTRLRLNTKMAFVFFFLTSCYHCMAFDFQLVHNGWLANYCGGRQIVYSVRYIEWTVCAPIVFSIQGQLPPSTGGKPRNGLIPSGLLTGIYCIISWQGLVVADALAAWVCIIWAFVCYFVASVEQLMYAWWVVDKGAAGPVRAFMLVYLVFCCGMYGVVYLLPIPGWLSPTIENKIYCVFDASFKLGSSIMLISTYDLAVNDEMRRRAQTTAEDLRHLIDTASVPIFGVDSDGQIDQWNLKARELTGLSEEDACRQSLLSLLGPERRDEVNDMVAKALQGISTGYVETTMRKVQRGAIPDKATLVLSASSRRDKQGVVTGVTFVGCDLTEVEAFKEAETRKTRFMAIVSHELRSPLHGIIGLAERLVDDEPDVVKVRLLRMVGSCASRLLDLVVNIMEMASLSHQNAEGKTKRLKLQRDPVELPKIMEEIVTLVRNSMDKSGHPLLRHGVELIHKRRALPVIEGDAHRLTQVFYNIITNACKFTVKGHITVFSHLDENNRYVEVAVRDTGRGIPQHAVDRIFQPFEQEDSSDARHYEGVGLGLSIAQEVVRLHGGHISVDSQVGVGTTFTVRLPMVMADNVTDPSERIVRHYSTEPEVTGAPECKASWQERSESDKFLVLSVDDDEVNQMVIESILKPEYEVHICMDGQSALEYLQMCGKNLPDVVLLDVMMPGMSGFEVCRNIRREMQLDATTLPVLMVSANPSPSGLAKGFESGCNDYIMKPFEKRVMKAHIEAALGAAKPSSRRAAAPPNA